MSDEKEQDQAARRNFRLILARESLVAVAHEWSDDDVLRLAALVKLGTPTELHEGFPPALAELDHDPGGVVGVRRLGGIEDMIRASALHTWRQVADRAGVPLPPPGHVK